MKVALQIIGTAALILLGGLIVWIAVFRISGDMRAAKAAKDLREASRTHDRALSHADFLGLAAEALQTIRPPLPAGSRYMGFVSMPAFGVWNAVSVSLSADDDEAHGQVVAFGKKSRFPVQSFSMPKETFLSVESKVHHLTDSYEGSETELCMDGVEVAFELRGPTGQATSGTGNASCRGHYAPVSEAFQPVVQAAGAGWKVAFDP